MGFADFGKSILTNNVRFRNRNHRHFKSSKSLKSITNNATDVDALNLNPDRLQKAKKEKYIQIAKHIGFLLIACLVMLYLMINYSG